jgi:hypothetical protein
MDARTAPHHAPRFRSSVSYLFSDSLSAFVRFHPWFLFLFLACAPVAAQRVVDRIVATVEGEPVTLSELRELARFQQLAGGGAASEKELLDRRIEQWIVFTEAQASGFARPAATDVEREMNRLARPFPSAEAFGARLRELELSEAGARRLVELQLYLARYLEAKFRPAAQIEQEAVEAYYRGEFTRALAGRGQAVPPLADVGERIREVLVQRDITERAGRWLDESRKRLRIQIRPEK